jgi:hypothetical protein
MLVLLELAVMVRLILEAKLSRVLVVLLVFGVVLATVLATELVGDSGRAAARGGGSDGSGVAAPLSLSCSSTASAAAAPPPALAIDDAGAAEALMSSEGRGDGDGVLCGVMNAGDGGADGARGLLAEKPPADGGKEDSSRRLNLSLCAASSLHTTQHGAAK